MKTWSNLLAGILAAGVLVGCNNESESEGPFGPLQPDSKDAVYMSVDIALPTARNSRSATKPDSGSTDGTETGQDYENKVNSLLFVLADTDDNVIGSNVIGIFEQQGSTIKATASITLTALHKFYDDLGARDKNVNVYAFCNPTSELIEAVGKADWRNGICGVIEGKAENKNTVVWKKNSFLMSNAEIAQRRLPDDIAEWTKSFGTEKAPFDLCGKNGESVDNSAKGAIKVERSVARFDYRDGNDSGKERTYNIGVTGGVNDGSLQVELIRMALVNMSKEFYYLRRVSADGLAAAATICGTETDKNYVVDTDSEFKNQGNDADAGDVFVGKAAELPSHFNYCLFNNDGRIDPAARKNWDSYDMAKVISGDALTGDEWTGTDKDKKNYHIWRYVTENTIPGVSAQRNGISTGVVFKGKLVIPENSGVNETLKKAVSGNYDVPDTYTKEIDGKKYPILYVFNHKLYVGWNDQIKAEIDKGEGSPIYNAAMSEVTDKSGKSLGIPNDLYRKVLDTKGKDEAALSAFKKAAVAAGFTLYEASDDAESAVEGEKDYGVGYFFYYYYWNRHNDNNIPAAMGPMEFAVVRNNVYKLSVTKINRLGHPRVTENDPDPVDPDTPDEKGDVYLKLSVEVLPWVVRVNNIEF